MGNCDGVRQSDHLAASSVGSAPQPAIDSAARAGACWLKTKEEGVARADATAARLTAAAVVCAAAAFVFSSCAAAANAHPGGVWALSHQIELALIRANYVVPTCSGRGAYRFGPVRNPSPATWLYRHFECVVGDPPTLQLCVHTLSSGRLVVYRHSLATSYNRCRF